MSGQACAYLVSRYPGLTHTFVVGEVQALRAQGVRVETGSVRRVPDAEVLSPLDAQEQRRTRALLPVSPLALVRVHLHALARGPRAYLATFARALRSAPAAGRAQLWQLFYFGESMLLWDWMRRQGLHHVHVHHANVPSDLAMLACGYANGSGASPRWTWSLTVHGPTEFQDAAAHRLAAKVADASLVACISDFTRSQVAAEADPADLGKLHTVRCGIDASAFARHNLGRFRISVTWCFGSAIPAMDLTTTRSRRPWSSAMR